jgi:hypothetical protein
MLSYEIIFHGHFLSLWIKYFELFFIHNGGYFFLIWDQISPTFYPVYSAYIKVTTKPDVRVVTVGQSQLNNFQLYHGENKLIFNEMMSAFY